MSHLIIENIDTVYTPNSKEFASTWHGLQETLETKIEADGSNVPDVFAPIFECAMKPDIDAEVSDIPEDLQKEISMEDWKIIMADCRNGKSGKVLPLHIPKRGYSIHQNKDLFDAMIGAVSSVMGENGFEIATVGTLGGYTQFFLSIALKGHESFSIGENDIWNQYFNLISSHNGLVGSARLISTIRMVCMNTVNAAIANAEAQDTKQSIKHTKNSLELITAKAFESDLKTWIDSGETFRASMEAIKAEPMALNTFKSFAAGVFTSAKSDKISTTSFNRVEDLAGLFTRGLGNVGETRYDAVNAFTEYFTSGRGTGGESVNMAKRVATANFGRANDWKREAVRIATDENLTIETVNRGEQFLNDYVSVGALKN